jgi:hypothetical protein
VTGSDTADTIGASVVISELSKIEHPDTTMKQMGMITPFLVMARLLVESATEERNRHAENQRKDALLLKA